jgi:branched-chain amino acid transport system permease protein
VLLLLGAPLWLDQGHALTLLSQMCAMTVLALSYNLLLGQTGMLSFGHAVYSGLGGFFAVHALNLTAGGAFGLPVALVPLVGGLAGAVFGVLFGWLTTARGGTPFAMISLGIGELTYAVALMFPNFFGGEAGVSTNRVVGEPVLGITYGPDLEVYYLIAGWTLLSAIAMYGFTRTPLGLVANAVRDNAQRVGFIGYDARRVRFLVLVAAAFFAGIAGALGAINVEIASVENLGALRSGYILLAVVIGGTGFFFGPVLGAVTVTFFSMALSQYTVAWQLYLGLVFAAIVLFAPGGLAGLGMRQWDVIAREPWRAWGPFLLHRLGSLALIVAGGIVLIEMAYRLNYDQTGNTVLHVWGWSLDASAWQNWVVCLAAIVAGIAVLARAGNVKPADMRSKP